MSIHPTLRPPDPGAAMAFLTGALVVRQLPPAGEAVTAPASEQELTVLLDGAGFRLDTVTAVPPPTGYSVLRTVPL